MIGYHATKKENEESILKNGYMISKSNNYHHWLGEGIYFWADSYYAVEWNIIDLGKNGIVTLKNMIMKYTIFETIINDNKDRTIDLSSPKGTIIFNSFKKNVLECANEEQKKKLKKINDDVFWVNFMKEKGIFEKYDVIIATFDKIITNVKKRKNNFQKYQQTQICVKNNKLITQNNIYTDKDEIKFLYNYIRNNRDKEKKEVLI